jgi:hypothetical protein
MPKNLVAPPNDVTPLACTIGDAALPRRTYADAESNLRSLGAFESGHQQDDQSTSARWIKSEAENSLHNKGGRREMSGIGRFIFAIRRP